MKLEKAIVPILIAFFATFLLEYYVYQGIRTFSLQFGAQVQNLINLVFWGQYIVLILSVLFGSIAFARQSGTPPAAKIIFHAFIIIFLSKIAFISPLLGEDVYRLITALVTGLSSKLHFPERQLWISLFSFICGFMMLLLMVYGVTKGKYKYKVHELTLSFDNLPDQFDGFKISHISDIHAGSLKNFKAVEKGIKIINALQADLFVFSGDLVNNSAAEFEPWVAYFKKLEAPFGKFSVLGNHDYGDYIRWNSVREKAENLEQLKRYHQQTGFRLLLDEHVMIRKNGQSIALIGVENWGLGFGQRGNLAKAMKNVADEDFKILLSHDPSHWHKEVLHRPSPIQLTLSGHTHGMQFGIETKYFSWSPVQYRYPHWAGLKNVDDRHLYINRGFGFLGFSGRVGIWPEITLITLRHKKA